MDNTKSINRFLPIMMKSKKMDEKHKRRNVGNSSLVSTEEARMAEMLRVKNLAHANEIADEVNPKVSFYSRYGKRVIDIVLSAGACALLAPVNLAFAACTFADVGRPIVFKQSRCGLNGKEFVLVKFRNMNNATDEDGKLLPAAERVTEFGRFMRKYSFDELLNFWSVLKGDMSIIGPRPLPVFFHDRMSERHKMRTAVRPGLECPRVIHLDEDDLCQYHIQFENDIWYVENISLKTDAKMVLMLIGMVFDFGNRDHRAKGNAASYFVGYDEEGHALSMNTARQMYPDVVSV